MPEITATGVLAINLKLSKSAADLLRTSHLIPSIQCAVSVVIPANAWKSTSAATAYRARQAWLKPPAWRKARHAYWIRGNQCPSRSGPNHLLQACKHPSIPQIKKNKEMICLDPYNHRTLHNHNNKHHHSKKDPSNNHNNNNNRQRKELELNEIYDGVVTRVKDFGCFVAL